MLVGTRLLGAPGLLGQEWVGQQDIQRVASVAPWVVLGALPTCLAVLDQRRWWGRAVLRG